MGALPGGAARSLPAWSGVCLGPSVLAGGRRSARRPAPSLPTVRSTATRSCSRSACAADSPLPGLQVTLVGATGDAGPGAGPRHRGRGLSSRGRSESPPPGPWRRLGVASTAFQPLLDRRGGPVSASSAPGGALGEHARPSPSRRAEGLRVLCRLRSYAGIGTRRAGRSRRLPTRGRRPSSAASGRTTPASR